MSDSYLSKSDIIKLARRIAKDNNGVLTRELFREVGGLKDSSWKKHFKLFTDLKEAAGLNYSRHVTRVRNSINKHLSYDKMRKLSAEKASYEGRWERPDNGRRFKSILAVSDIHDKHADPFWWSVVVDTAKRLQPEIIVINGDLFDLPEFSKYNVDPRTWDVVGRIKIAHSFIEELREASPDSQIDLIEGNHEFRLLRHLSEATPALQSVLSDLHGFDIPTLLGIDKYEVNYIGRSDLTAWTEKDIRRELDRNWKIYWDCVLSCHYPSYKKLSIPGFGGHHHKHIVWPFYSPAYGQCEFHQMGCGHVRSAVYMDGEMWQTGFLIAHVDTVKKHTNFEYVQVQDHAVVGGKWYIRGESDD